MTPGEDPGWMGWSDDVHCGARRDGMHYGRTDKGCSYGGQPAPPPKAPGNPPDLIESPGFTDLAEADLRRRVTDLERRLSVLERTVSDWLKTSSEVAGEHERRLRAAEAELSVLTPGSKLASGIVGDHELRLQAIELWRAEGCPDYAEEHECEADAREAHRNES